MQNSTDSKTTEFSYPILLSQNKGWATSLNQIHTQKGKT